MQIFIKNKHKNLLDFVLNQMYKVAVETNRL